MHNHTSSGKYFKGHLDLKMYGYKIVMLDWNGKRNMPPL
jgi:hypothetical protein